MNLNLKNWDRFHYFYNIVYYLNSKIMKSEIIGQFLSSLKIIIFLSTENERVEVLEKMKLLINHS